MGHAGVQSYSDSLVPTVWGGSQPGAVQKEGRQCHSGVRNRQGGGEYCLGLEATACPVILGSGPTSWVLHIR